MTPRNSQAEEDRPPRRSRASTGSILGIAAAFAFGGAWACLTGWIASTWIWGGDQPLLAARVCLACYLVLALSSFVTAPGSSPLDREGVDRGEWSSLSVLGHLGFSVLSFPLAYAGGYVGRLADALVRMFTAPFGPT